MVTSAMLVPLFFVLNGCTVVYQTELAHTRNACKCGSAAYPPHVLHVTVLIITALNFRVHNSRMDPASLPGTNLYLMMFEGVSCKHCVA